MKVTGATMICTWITMNNDDSDDGGTSMGTEVGCQGSNENLATRNKERCSKVE